MLIKDINYLETVNERIEGGFAIAYARAGRSFAQGNNYSETSDVTDTSTSQSLFVFNPDPITGIGPVYARMTANGFAESYSQSS